ncbi:MAG TPA: cellulase family glycosylhydrolase [Candidatus Binatia bacterium]|nr:cellulase family glycosylhydrolase [Candidatus Binatia bacterium]
MSTSSSAAPHTTSGAASPTALLSSIYGVGVDVIPIDLLDQSGIQPTGQALADQMQQDHVQLVRLAWGDQYQSQMDAHNNWKTVFDRLANAGISAILTLHQQAPGANEGPGVSRAVITDETALISAEEQVLEVVKQQNGGAYPRNLVGIDVFNEPVLDSATVSSLQQLASAIKAYTDGIPTTIGGWSDASRRTAQDFNDPSLTGLAATIGDFLEPHLYPANMPGGSQTSTSVSEIEPFATSFLTTMMSQLQSSGHAGELVIIGETGGDNGQAPSGGFQQGGSPAHQEASLQAVLQAVRGFESQNVRGVLDWWVTPPPGETCNGGALICFNGTYTATTTLALLPEYQFGSE